IDALLARDGADVLVVKQGRRCESNRTPTPDEARRLFADGHTLLVRHAERQDERLAGLAERFRADFHAPVDVHLYATPGGVHGFGWHYDAEDVFILQTQGSKEYALRKNTVNPWPLVESLPADMRYERELMPIMKCLLRGGDWLYIPGGHWHRAEAKEDSISLAVGVLVPAAMDAFDHLRRRLVDSIYWRQRLPITGDARTESEEELIERYRALFAELADDLSRQMRDEAFVRSFLDR
ncbi:MAG: JmjC domain-containing protein, partial [Planctomycetaceae bacterium]